MKHLLSKKKNKNRQDVMGYACWSAACIGTCGTNAYNGCHSACTNLCTGANYVI